MSRNNFLNHFAMTSAVVYQTLNKFGKLVCSLVYVSSQGATSEETKATYLEPKILKSPELVRSCSILAKFDCIKITSKFYLIV